MNKLFEMEEGLFQVVRPCTDTKLINSLKTIKVISFIELMVKYTNSNRGQRKNGFSSKVRHSEIIANGGFFKNKI